MRVLKNYVAWFLTVWGGFWVAILMVGVPVSLMQLATRGDLGLGPRPAEELVLMLKVTAMMVAGGQALVIAGYWAYCLFSCGAVDMDVPGMADFTEP